MLRGLRHLRAHWGMVAEARLAASGAQVLEGSSSVQRWLPPAVAWQQRAGYSTEDFKVRRQGVQGK